MAVAERRCAVLTTAEMAEADRMTIADGTPGLILMERAGRAVADACLEAMASITTPTLTVLCGPGKNGGDGFVVARLLQQAGWVVHCNSLGEIHRLAGDAAEAARAWAGSIHSLEKLDLRGVDLVVDALFGAGLARPLVGLAREAVDLVNASGLPVVAVDVPSGIDGNTGAVQGAAIQAALTVTFFRPKPGHHLYPGASHCGRLVVADIGIPPAVIDHIASRIWLNGPDLWNHLYPWPRIDGHKYQRGHAVVMSGGLSHTGAARLSARAALRIGAGLVTLASPTDALAVNAAHLTAIMLRAADAAAGLADLLADPRKNTVILGPGLGVGGETRDLVAAALAPQAEQKGAPRTCVLDADALTSFAGNVPALSALIAKAPGAVVITPHDGEFARLFASLPDVTEQPSKVERTRAAARTLGCVVLLKGADTVVADSGGRASIAAEAVPWLATAGSGDVLSGLIGGLLAQAMPAFEAASAAVYLHAAAARLFGPGLIAEDLPETLPAALRALHERAGV